MNGEPLTLFVHPFVFLRNVMQPHEHVRRQPPLLDFDPLTAWYARPPEARTIVCSKAPVIVHRHQSIRKSRPYASRGLLGVVLLLGVCVALAAWNATPSSSKESPVPQSPDAGKALGGGFALRTEQPAHKFNSTSAEAPKMPAPPKDTEKPTPPPPLVLELPPVEIPPMPPMNLEPMTVVPVVFNCPGSLVCSCFRDLHQGETPMLRNWNFIKLSSLMAVALAPIPLPAAEPAQITQDELKALREPIDALVKKLDAMNDTLGFVKTDVKRLSETSDDTKLKIATMDGAINALTTQVANLKADLERIQGRASLYPGEKNGLSEITSRLAKIEETLARMADAPRISNAPPLSTGRILLANMYPEEMLFLVNGKSYRVAPYTTATLENQPAGIFNYEVISGTYGRLRGSNPLLEPSKTYTITVR
jgi:hypothetical protein